MEITKRKRCYLSGPITGVDGYMEKFNEHEHGIRNLFRWSVINPARVNGEMPDDTSYEEYMEMSITMMKMCDCIFLMPGWENSKGARFEREYAIIRGMDIYEESSDGAITIVRSIRNSTMY